MHNMTATEMTGKELLLKALRNEETPRPAWVPFVGCHGGKLIDKPADEYLASSELMIEGLRAAARQYRPDGLPIAFDLQIEAEALGCKLHWAEEVPPSVITHPLATGKLEDLPAFSTEAGRFPLIAEVMNRIIPELGDTVAFYGLICGPFTLALHLLGNDIFLEMFDDPAGVRRLVQYCADIGIETAAFYRRHGADIVAVVDPMTSQISPDHFDEFVTPSLNRIFDAVRADGGLSSLFVCGDANRNLEVMCRTTADNISVDEQISMDRLRELCQAAGKSFGGNIKLTSVLLLGDEQDSRREAAEVIEQGGHKGFVLAPGCDLPYGTPPANLEAISEVVHDPYSRELARTTEKEGKEDTFEDVEVPDYHTFKPVVIDVITLDSTSCAPCQYMMEAVNRAARDAFVKTYVNEHKIKVRTGLGMMSKLGVKNLPTICIDGEVRFSSIIPDHDTLVRAIEDHAIGKNLRKR